MSEHLPGYVVTVIDIHGREVWRSDELEVDSIGDALWDAYGMGADD